VNELEAICSWRSLCYRKNLCPAELQESTVCPRARPLEKEAEDFDVSCAIIMCKAESGSAVETFFLGST
jgi:hypothetical protein